MNIVIYTAICGWPKQGPLKIPKVPCAGARHVIFTDRDLGPLEGWEQLALPIFSDDGEYANRRNAKAPKILSHLFLPDADYSLWVDTGIHWSSKTHEFGTVSEGMIEKALGGHDLAFFKHPRKSTYAEIECIEGHRLDRLKTLTRQKQAYVEAGFPDKEWPLPMGGRIFRRHTSQIARFNLAWYEQICRYSARDQASVCYAAWKTETKYALIQ